ncbi:hypothetical protein [Yoonia maricola]|nr:hypothetical protein [Yoonia maricola]
MVMPALSQGQWNDVSDRLDGVQNWEELCTIEDCSQFPEGYATQVIGPEIYYFSHYSILTEKPPAVYSIRPQRFVDRDVSGELIRSFDYSDTMRLPWCCYYLMSFFDLGEDFPAIGKFEPRDKIVSATVKLVSWDAGDGSITSIRRMMRIDEPYGSPPPTFDEIFLDELDSLNDDFWLIDFQPASADNIPPRYFFISKRRLFNDRFIAGGCYRRCSFSTVTFAEDGDNRKARFSVSGLWIAETAEFHCTEDGSGRVCNDAPEALNQIDEFLERLELLFQTAQMKPG